jgi:hypothetical protein
VGGNSGAGRGQPPSHNFELFKANPSFGENETNQLLSGTSLNKNEAGTYGVIFAKVASRQTNQNLFVAMVNNNSIV